MPVRPIEGQDGAAQPFVRVVDDIRNQRGVRFDPRLTDLFLDALDDFDRIRRESHGSDLPADGDPPVFSERDPQKPVVSCRKEAP